MTRLCCQLKQLVDIIHATIGGGSDR